jgi:phytoene/squalene synthetase
MMSTSLASSITKASGKQTYYTIRFLVDRSRIEDAYRAYAYFRWVDDILDTNSGLLSERLVFLERQKNLLDSCYSGEPAQDINIQENMLVELVHHDREENSGLQKYLRNMMRLLDFDTKRRGRLISQAELNEYTHWLAVAATECLLYFIGHGEYTPHVEARYMAVSAAHIAHLLRDTYEDVQAGYYNIPREVLEILHIGPQDVESEEYRAWVKSRVEAARQYFRAGKDYLAQIQNLRARLAGFAYTARFEWLLDTIEREDFYLRHQYDERKRIGTGLRMSWLAFSSTFHSHGATPLTPPFISHL